MGEGYVPPTAFGCRYMTHLQQDRDFAENLTRAMLHPSRTSEVAMICALDICRAASRIQPGEDLPLVSWAIDTAHEIKVRADTTRMQLTTHCERLQTTLFKWGGTAKAFYDCPDEIDVALVADALVTIFRFLPEAESVPIIMQALRPEMSDAVKISAIKACLTLITDVRVLYFLVGRALLIDGPSVPSSSMAEVAGRFEDASYTPTLRDIPRTFFALSINEGL